MPKEIDMDENEWHEWRGAADARLKANESMVQEIDSRIVRIEDKIGEIIAKISGPLMLMQIVGTVVGAVVVLVVTKMLK